MPINPYLAYKKKLEKLQKERAVIENKTLEFWNEVKETFLPDQEAFMNLVDQAKKLTKDPHATKELDATYLKMAIIYKKWLPIEQEMLTMNPTLKDLSVGLKEIIKEAKL